MTAPTEDLIARLEAAGERQWIGTSDEQEALHAEAAQGLRSLQEEVDSLRGEILQLQE